ncbi:MAG: NADH-quinone oxidoreductase subunit C [Nocardioidaceae bacterium]
MSEDKDRADERAEDPAGGAGRDVEADAHEKATTESSKTQDPSHENAKEIATSEVTELEIVDVREGMFGVRGTGDTSGYGGLTRPVILPGASQRPYGGWFDDVADRLEIALRDNGVDNAIEKVVVDRGEITFFIRRERIADVAQQFRDDEGLRFELCSGVSGVHYPHESGRELHAVYHLLSMTHNRRVRLEVAAPDEDPHVPSVVSVYPTADWHERETYDFFGIIFDGHPALTRILMPDDWPGHPQRKDYPLGGIPVEYKGATIPPPDQRRSYN